MKLEKKHWIIIGVVVAIILVWYFFLRKKNGGNVAKLLSGNQPQGRAFIPGAGPGQAELERMKDEKTKLKTGESSFRGGRGGHHGGRWHGGRGWGGGWWGYPYGGFPYEYYDDIYRPIVVNSTSCPEGWIWMGAMLGCQQPG